MDVELRNLSYAYVRNSQVLSDVDLVVRSGTSVAVLGASGSGKSTLLKLVAGFIRPPVQNGGLISGDIRINGASIFNAGGPLPTLKKEGKIGYLFQSPFLLNHLSVWRNICLPSEIIGTRDEAKIQSVVELVGLSDHTRKLPKELSGGMRTRAALARMFSTDPELLLLDEPFSSIDVALRTELYVEFNRLADMFKNTMILVTHDVFEAIVFSRQLCILNLSGKAIHYTVRDWRPHRSYEEVVRENFSCFSEVSEIIKSHT